MLKAIAKPFGVLMLFLYNLTKNYGVAIILFALVVKLLLLPPQLKSKKSMMHINRMTPKLQELEKKYGNDQQRYQMEMAKLYKEEGVNPMGGCLWSLLPFPILIALYQAIRYPLTIMMRVPEALLEEGGAIFQKMLALGYTAPTGRMQYYEQLYQSKFITEHFEQFAGISDRLQTINYNFLGLDLSQTPTFTFWNWDFSDPAKWLPSLGLFMIPVISALLSWISMKTANAGSPQPEQQSMKIMNLMMPLMSLYICFTMPAVMGIYWIAQSVFAIAQDVILGKVFTKKFDKQDAERISREKEREAELEAKRKETERLKAEGATVENKNTSKKNKKAVAAQKETERKAAEVRAAKLAKRGTQEEETLPSQVGDRRYARGRAYVPDRYTNPEEAERKTAEAAAESESFAEQNTETESAEEVKTLPEEIKKDAKDGSQPQAEQEPTSDQETITEAAAVGDVPEEESKQNNELPASDESGKGQELTEDKT